MFFEKRNTYDTKKFLKNWQGRMIETIVPHRDSDKGGLS